MKMGLYQITRGGVVYGQYEARSPRDALMAFAADVGGSGTEMAVSDSGLEAVLLHARRRSPFVKPVPLTWFGGLNAYQAAVLGAAILALAIAGWDWLK